MVGFGSAPRAVGGGSQFVAPHASPTLAKAIAPSGPAHPSVLGNVSAVVKYDTALAGYMHLPLTVTFTATITNMSAGGVVHYKNLTNTWVSLELRDVNGVCEGGYGLSHNCPTIVNITMNDSVTNGSSTWSHNISLADLQTVQGHPWCPNAPCAYAAVLPNDQYQIVAWVTLNNGVSNASFNTEGTRLPDRLQPGGDPARPDDVRRGLDGQRDGRHRLHGQLRRRRVGHDLPGTTTAGKVVYTQGLFVPVRASTRSWQPRRGSSTVAGTYDLVINIYGTVRRLELRLHGHRGPRGPDGLREQLDLEQRLGRVRRPELRFGGRDPAGRRPRDRHDRCARPRARDVGLPEDRPGAGVAGEAGHERVLGVPPDVRDRGRAQGALEDRPRDVGPGRSFERTSSDSAAGPPRRGG